MIDKALQQALPCIQRNGFFRDDCCLPALLWLSREAKEEQNSMRKVPKPA